MPLVIEDGTGKADAESYISAADADAYIQAHGGSTEWDDASADERDEALRLATQFIDNEYRGRWKGIRKKREQALAWPRYNVLDEDGYAISSDTIPKALKDATSEMARRQLAEGLNTPLIPDSTSATIKEEEFEVGPITERIEYVGGKPEQKRFPLVDRLLAGLLSTSGSGAVGRRERG